MFVSFWGWRHLLSPRGAQVLLKNLGTSYAVPCDVITWISSSTDEELKILCDHGTEYKLKVEEVIRDQNREKLCTSAVLRLKMFYKFKNKDINKTYNRIAQFGETPILWLDSRTEYDT